MKEKKKRKAYSQFPPGIDRQGLFRCIGGGTGGNDNTTLDLVSLHRAPRQFDHIQDRPEVGVKYVVRRLLQQPSGRIPRVREVIRRLGDACIGEDEIYRANRVEDPTELGPFGDIAFMHHQARVVAIRLIVVVFWTVAIEDVDGGSFAG